MPEGGQNMTETCSIHHEINVKKIVLFDRKLSFTVS